MSKKVIGLVALVGISATAAFMGCSAATTTITTPDAGATTDSGKLVGDSGKPDTGSSSGGDTGPASCYDEKGKVKLPAATGKAGQNVCSPTQITGYYNACLGKAGSDTACAAFMTDAANARCLGCIDGTPPEGGVNPFYPALLPGDSEGDTVYNNDLTCAYLVIKKPECIPRAVDSFVCFVTVCSTCAEGADFDACLDQAEAGACKDVLETKACTDAYDAGAAQIAATCGADTDDFETVYGKVVPFLCGPARDGG